MKNLKIYLWAMVAVAAGFFTACNDEDFESGPNAKGAQVYFPDYVTTEYSIGDEISSIAIPVKRIQTEEAQTVAVLSEDQSGLFSIPSAVSFAAGSDTSELLITFNRAKLVDGQTYPLAFLINDDDVTTAYGNRSLNLTITPWPWEYLGVGLYRDDYFTGMFNGGNVEIEVDIYESKSNPGLYMIENMFGWPFLTEFFGAEQAAIEAQAVTYTPTNIVLNCTRPSQVLFERQQTGIVDIDPEYGAYEIGTVQYGSLDNGIITFPKEGLALYCLQGGMYTNKNGLFRIILPGYEASDYSLAAAYDGMKVASDNETASAVIDFTYGADVTAISYVFLADDQTASAATIAGQIVAGKVDNVYKVENLPSDASTVSVQGELSLAGMYTVVALPHDKAGNPIADGVAATAFFFPGMSGEVAPECDIEVVMLPPSEMFNPETAAKYPDTHYIAYMIRGTDLKSVRRYVNTTKLCDEVAPEQGLTYADLLAQYGADLSEAQLGYIAEDGYFANVLSVEPNTSYTFIVKGTNSYGKSKIASTSCKSAGIPYSGEMVIGDYLMHFDAPLQGGGTTPCESIFAVSPQKADNDTDFFVSDFGVEIGIDWYAAYDSASSELTLNGIWKDNEDNGSFLGGWVGLSSTEAIMFYSYASEDSEGGADPIVVSVDPTTHELTGLKTNLEIVVAPLSGNSVNTSQMQVVALFYADGTTITPYSGTTQSVKAFQGGRSTRIPFSSVRVPIDTKVSHRIVTSAFKEVSDGSIPLAGFVETSGVRTLKVNASRCEPLPKKAGSRIFKAVKGLKVLEK